MLVNSSCRRCDCNDTTDKFTDAAEKHVMFCLFEPIVFQHDHIHLFFFDAFSPCDSTTVETVLGSDKHRWETLPCTFKEPSNTNVPLTS